MMKIMSAPQQIGEYITGTVYILLKKFSAKICPSRPRSLISFSPRTTQLNEVWKSLSSASAFREEGGKVTHPRSLGLLGEVLALALGLGASYTVEVLGTCIHRHQWGFEPDKN